MWPLFLSRETMMERKKIFSKISPLFGFFIFFPSRKTLMDAAD